MRVTLTFYRVGGSATVPFWPIEFGDLKVRFNYGRGKKDAIIPKLTQVLREEKEAFDARYPHLSLPWKERLKIAQ